MGLLSTWDRESQAQEDHSLEKWYPRGLMVRESAWDSLEMVSVSRLLAKEMVSRLLVKGTGCREKVLAYPLGLRGKLLYLR